MLKGIFILMSEKNVLSFCRSNLNYGLRSGKTYRLPSVIKSFDKIEQTGEQRTECPFGDINFFLDDITLLCLYIAKLEQLDYKRLFVGASGNTYYWMLGDVKNVMVKITIYVSFVRKLLQYFFVKWIDFAQTGSLLSDRHQLILVNKTCRNETIGSKHRYGLRNEFNFRWRQDFCFNQSHSNMSFWIIK